jgi:enterochelin esterase-like enzyme
LAPPEAQRQARVDSLFANLPGGQGPIREDGQAHFIYRGTATSMQLAGDMTGWNPSLNFSSVSGTNFWFMGFNCANTARLDYKFVRNGSSWILDPVNPNTCSGGFGPNSELAMPAYVQPPEILDHGYPACGDTSHPGFFSPQLQNTRTIRVLTPPGYPAEGEYPVLVVHDGLEYISLAQLDNVLAWMAVERPQVRLPICVCIPPVNRSAEYDGAQQAAFGQFIVDTVVPFINQNYATRAGDPDWWGNLGASSGGDIATYMAGEYPQVFNRVIAMSPYLPSAQFQRIQERPLEGFRMYLNWGSYDIASLLPLIADFRGMLEERSAVHLAREFEEGHSWGLWRATIDEGLEFIWPRETGIESGERGALPDTWELRAWPNPFNGQLRIQLDPTEQPVSLSIHNSLGQRLEGALQQTAPGSWTWQPGTLASGRYWIQARSGLHRDQLSVIYIK